MERFGPHKYNRRHFLPGYKFLAQASILPFTREMLCCLLASMLFLGVCSSGLLLADTVLPDQGGGVDWTRLEIVSWGRADPYFWPIRDAVGQRIVQRQALLRSRHMLWQTLLRVRLQGSATLADLLGQDHQLYSLFQGLVHNSFVSGVLRLDNGTVEVRSRMFLTGPVMHELLPRLSWSGSVEGQQTNASSEANLPWQASQESTTGVVIDARGTGFEPALFIVLEDEHGQKLFSREDVEQKVIVDRGMVGYAPDIATARLQPRVAGDPLLVRAVAEKDDGHLVILQEQADFLRHQKPFARWVKSGQMVVVWDGRKTKTVLEYQLY